MNVQSTADAPSVIDALKALQANPNDPRAHRGALDAIKAHETAPVESDPAALLVHAYAKAGDGGASWEDVNTAHAAARAQLGAARCAEIEALYADDPLEDFNYVGTRHHY